MEISQYELFQRMVGVKGDPIELYPIDSLPHIISDFHTQKLVELIVEENKKGYATFLKELRSCWPSSNSHFYKVMKNLEENGIINRITIMQLAFLFSKREGKLKFYSIPENVIIKLEEYRCKKGNASTWNKKFKKMDSRAWPKVCFALFYDKEGPVYKNCFPKIELKYVPKILKTYELTPLL